MGPELRVKRTSGENVLDYPEIIEDLECARLDALATRSLEGHWGGLDQTKRDAAAREIQGERQSGWSGPDDQHRGFVHRTNIRLMVQCTNVKPEIQVDPREVDA